VSEYSAWWGDMRLQVRMAIEDGEVSSVRLEREKAPDEPYPILDRVMRAPASGDTLEDVPVRLDVTPFARDVLTALRSIRPGAVITYGGLAARIGRPDAARAVGGACARNPVPVIVPCHRVVPASGGVGSYSADGGAATKRRLLRLEGGREFA